MYKSVKIYMDMDKNVFFYLDIGRVDKDLFQEGLLFQRVYALNCLYSASKVLPILKIV